MRVEVGEVVFSRDGFCLRANGTFDEGVHIVSGPVGSGKSTLAILLAGLITPASGTVQRQGVNSVLLLLQFPEHQITAPTVEREAASWGLAPDEVLALADLEERADEDPFHLSRGELKRLTLACAFIRDPDLLLLDEPFSSLDCERKRWVCSMIEERWSGITVIFSHEQSVLPRVDAIWEMEDGALIERGSVPGAIPSWRHAPAYLACALERGARPENIRLADAREALCRIRD
ncbi:ABC transporter ATP-binding protein [Methanoculleus receptaculi]|uniref:ABC transporter ATP-binding protein n=1 Tax=Methanoculleus receptaculi TaxID=394967 RepID=A0AAX4FSX2_9EURY|nr:ABC transporter ATP-binding protein [Methanoculleus receptaculi]WOX56890.1 ABC transporter ATP-binding protein [Methanoculleus receptaculi]